MVKLLLLTTFAALFICISAQRPFYASGQYPSVLPQNLPSSTDLDNRFGENSTSSPYNPNEKDPVYNVEKELVDRIKNEYPRDKQPFWYTNAAQLNYIRNQQQIQSQTQQLDALRLQQESIQQEITRLQQQQQQLQQQQQQQQQLQQQQPQQQRQQQQPQQQRQQQQQRPQPQRQQQQQLRN